MASPFSKYQQGIQPIANAYQMMSAPSQIMGAAITNATKTISDSIDEARKAEREKARQDQENALKEEIANKNRVSTAARYLAETSTKLYDIDAKAHADGMKDDAQESQTLTSQLDSAIKDKNPDQQYIAKLRAQVQEVNNRTASRRQSLQKSRDAATNATKMLLMYSGMPDPEEEAAKAAALKKENERSSYLQGGGGSGASPASFYQSGSQTSNIAYNPQRKGGSTGPVAQSGVQGASGFRELPKLSNPSAYSEDGLLRPVGTDEAVTELSTKYPYGNIGLDTELPPNVVGSARIKNVNGKLSVGMGVGATIADESTVATLSGYVGGINKTQKSDRVRLSKSLSPTAEAEALRTYNEAKENGGVDSSVTLIDWKAGHAIQAFENEDESAFTNLSAEDRANFGYLTAKSSPLAIVQKATPQTQETQSSSVVYRPLTEVVSAPSGRMTGPPSTEKLERMKQLGTDTFYGNVSPQFQTELSLFNAQNKEWELQQESDKLIQAQRTNEIAAKVAENKITETELDITGKVSQRSYGIPGIESTKGPDSILNAIKSIPYDSDQVDPYTYWQKLNKEAKARGPITPSVRAQLWNNMQAAYPATGAPQQLLIDEMKEASDATRTFDQGITQTTQMLSEFIRQSKETDLNNFMDRTFSARPSIAAGYRLFLLGAFRKATVGAGNPSNFEQELLLNLIADPKSIFQITGNSVARTRALMLITTNNYLRELKATNFKPSAETRASIAKRFISAGLLPPGSQVSQKMLDEFDAALTAGSGSSAEQLRGLQNWSNNHGVKGLGTIFDNREVDKQWVAAGTNDAKKARAMIDNAIAPEGINQEESSRNRSVALNFFGY